MAAARRHRCFMDNEPSSTKPYLLRALYEWSVDNGFTPYLQVVVDKDTIVPKEYIKNGEIVLNISPLASNKLKITNEHIEFQARFGGVARDLYVPMRAVGAIYTKENGQGMSFERERQDEPVAEADGAPHPVAPQRTGPRAIDDKPRDGIRSGSSPASPSEPPSQAPSDPPPDPPPESPPPGGRPSLRRIK